LHRSLGWIKRHWRGELPLPLSFWGIGILSLVLPYAWAEIIGFLYLDTFNPYVIFIGLVVIYSGVLGIRIWWWVGTWRSGTARTLHNPNSAWPKIAKAVICLAILKEIYIFPALIIPTFADWIADIKEDPQRGPRGVRPGRTESELEVYGSITRSVPLAFERAIESNPKISVVRFDSKGGRLGAAIQLRDVIRAHNLDTLVSTECSSSCVVTFLGGKRRLIESGARIGFHSTRSGREVSRVGNERFRQELEASGVSEAFLDKALATPPDSVWYPSYDELKSAGVTTGSLPMKSQYPSDVRGTLSDVR